MPVQINIAGQYEGKTIRHFEVSQIYGFWGGAQITFRFDDGTEAQITVLAADNPNAPIPPPPTEPGPEGGEPDSD